MAEACENGVEEVQPPTQVALYSAAKTSVWWDIENCALPKGSDPYALAQNISSALEKMNYCGPLSISAYGDATRISPAIQQALHSTGISFNHVPTGVKDASDKRILVDMLLWAVDNPAPANYLLISGDRDFANALHQLRMRRYNILLAQPQQASNALVAAAKTVWLWTSLSSGAHPLTNNESKQFVVNNSRKKNSNYDTPVRPNKTPMQPAQRLVRNKRPSMHQAVALPQPRRKKRKIQNKQGLVLTEGSGRALVWTRQQATSVTNGVETVLRNRQQCRHCHNDQQMVPQGTTGSSCRVQEKLEGGNNATPQNMSETVVGPETGCITRAYDVGDTETKDKSTTAVRWFPHHHFMSACAHVSFYEKIYYRPGAPYIQTIVGPM